MPRHLVPALAVLLLLPALALAGDELRPPSPELLRIQAAIEAEGLPWTAGETVRSRMTPEQRRAGLIPAEEFEARIAEIVSHGVAEPRVLRAESLPARFSWRDRFGHRFVSGVRNQGDCGSCMAFGFLGSLEALALWRLGRPYYAGSYDFDTSEQDLVDCARGADFRGCEGGSSWQPLYDYLEINGIAYESCYPYEAMNMTCRTAQCTERAFGEGHEYISGRTPSSKAEIMAFKKELYQRPISSYMVVYTDLHYYTGGVYVPTADAEFEGGHAVVVVGWDDEMEAWEIKNSWGQDWARDGHFYIRWGKSHAGAGALRLDYLEDTPPAELCELPERLDFDGSRLDRFRMLRLQNCGGSGLEWRLSTDVDWLEFSRSEGLALVDPPEDVRIDPVDPPPEGAQGTVTLTAIWCSYFEPDGTIRTEDYAIPVSISAASSGGGGGGSGGCSVLGGSGVAAGLLLLVALRARRRS